MKLQQVVPAIRHRMTFQRWVPYALLAVACALSVVATRYVTSTVEARSRSDFEADTAEIHRHVQVRLNSYIEIVRAGAALLGASNEINVAEFRAFVRRLQVRERYPGMAGIGFSQRIRRGDLRVFLRQMALDGVPQLRVWPPGRRPEYHAVLFLEPRDERNESAIGFDMSTDPVRRAAMERARDAGEPALSGRLTWVQSFEADTQPNLVLYIPVYRAASRTLTPDERARSLVGFVFSPFRGDDLLQQVPPARARSVTFEIFDGPSSSAPLLYRSGVGSTSAKYQSVASLSVAGREWSIAVRSTQAAVGVIPRVAQGTLAIGLMLSVMLFVITRAQVEAWESAARHGRELRASEEALRKGQLELHRMIELEREARTNMEIADRAKDEFLATLSHELRTPLNAVLGWVTMLRNGVVQHDRRDHVLEVIERNARLQAQLIEDLLDVSRIIMGKIRLEMHPISISPVISAVLDSVRATAEAKGITLHTNVSPTSGTTRADANRIQQIGWNLLSNAIKFTPAGGHVFVDVTRDQHHVELRVRDTGIGISPEFLPHVFERFRQADSSVTRPHSGVGLGLSIVQHLAELHGGSVDVSSEGLNRGATFWVRLPLLSVTTVPAVTGKPLESPLLGGVRVLVVDDDQDAREMLTAALGETGAHVTSADSAARAFELLVAQGADVLVSDIAMPGEDGLSLIRRVRAIPGNAGRTPAIALTAYAHSYDRAEAVDAGYQIHLTKPVELRELQAELVKLAVQHGHNVLGN